MTGEETRLVRAKHALTEARRVLREIRDHYDHDDDAHKYGTGCRCCIADAALTVIAPACAEGEGEGGA